MGEEQLQPARSLSGDSGPPLTTWKDIAAFFDRHVRTVQRWEREEGLPVHRHPHQKQSSVYAFPEELEAWWRGRSQNLRQGHGWTPWSHWLAWTIAGCAVTAALVIGIAWISGQGVPAVFRGSVGDGDVPLIYTTLLGSRANGWLSENASGDFDGDGVTDLVLTAGLAGRIYLLRGRPGIELGGDLELTADAVINGPLPGQWGARNGGDLNADGIDDLVVTHAPVEPESLTGSGKIYVLFGRAAWPATLDAALDADIAVGSDSPNDIRMNPCGWFGDGVDLNGDGIDDLLIGASEYSAGSARSAGAVFAVFGRPQWPARLELAQDADMAIFGSRSGEGLNGCAAGDLDADTRTDLVVLASEATLWNLLGGDEKLYAFGARDTWPRELRLGQADWKGRADRASEGISIFAIADVDGDGTDDVVTAWPEDTENPAAPGALRIWLGGAPGAEPPAALRDADGFRKPDLTISGPAPGGRFGRALGVADIDEDGADDLFLGAPGEEAVYLLLGGAALRAGAEPVALWREPRLASMWLQVSVGDFDDDGLPQAVIVAPDAAVGTNEANGVAFVLSPFVALRVDLRPDQIPNAVLLPHGVSAVRIYGETAGDPSVVGSSIRFAGAAPTEVVVDDYDGDGCLDLQAYFDNGVLQIPPGAERATILARTVRGLPAAGTDSILVVSNGAAR